MSWPELEDELIDWIPATFTGADAGMETGELSSKLGTLADPIVFVRVSKLGGTDDGVTDYQRIDFDAFALTTSAAKAFQRDLRDALKPRTRVGSAIIDTVRVDRSPSKVPWDNVNIKRVLMTCQISTRK